MALRLPRWLSRLSIRLLAFNALLVFLPVVGMLVLDTYEQHLLQAQEKTMVQEGRLLAASLGGGNLVDPEEARRILVQLALRHEARLRIIDGAGRPVADSSALGGVRSADPEPSAAVEPGAQTRLLYRLGSAPTRLLRRLVGSRPAPGPGTEFYSGQVYVLGPEVQAALEGRYGATTRVAADSPRTVTLYSAIPIRGPEMVIGAVLVSQSTNRIRQALYDVRLDVFKVFLASLAAAILLTLLVATTIARPLARLRRHAGTILDPRGRLRGGFAPSRRQDEIGDLERALAHLTERLERHLDFVESFASDVSHEFKNPLASIRTASEMALEVDDPVQRRRFLDIILKEVARMERLLSDVREVARIDAQIGAEERGLVALEPLLTSIVDAWRLRQRGSGPAFVLAVSDHELRVLASADRLTQVLENVLDNAAGFSPPGGTVSVSLHRAGGHAVIAVADEGPGIPPEHLGRLFSRFFSYRPGGESGEHTGLGLAIAQAIVEGYGGTLTATNRLPGGAAFAIELPLA